MPPTCFSKEKKRRSGSNKFVRQWLLCVLQGQAGRRDSRPARNGASLALKGAKKKALARVCNYLENNRACCTTTLVFGEGLSDCQRRDRRSVSVHLVKDRMERAGMHWCRPGAWAMLDVRSVQVNGDWEAYQSYRIERETARLAIHHRDLVAGEAYFFVSSVAGRRLLPVSRRPEGARRDAMLTVNSGRVVAFYAADYQPNITVIYRNCQVFPRR